MNSKIFTYVGFSKRSGKIRLGVNAVAFYKGRIPLMIVCGTASDNTKKDAAKLAKKHGAKLLVSLSDKVEDLASKPNCKLIAVLDDNLAKAIIDNIDDNFRYSEA